MKRLEAELKGKAQIERENREIYLEQIKMKAEEQRKTVMESIKTAGSVIGTGITTMLENPNRILLAVSWTNRFLCLDDCQTDSFDEKWSFVKSIDENCEDIT